MITKHITKIVLVFLCIAISLSICSCTGLSVHGNNIATFAADITNITSNLNNEALSSEEKIQMADKLFHPESNLSVEKIWEEVKDHEKLAGIGTITSVTVNEMPNMEDLMNLMKYDPETNTMSYHAEIHILINGRPIIVGIDLLSDDAGMGIVGYEIK